MKRVRTILQAREMLYVGAAAGVASVVSYGVHGYSSWTAWLWLAALLMILAHLFVTSGSLGRPSRWDLVAPGLLVLAFSPLYLLRLTEWPVQVNSDEVAIMGFAKQYASTPHVDLFGLSQYFGTPAGLLVVWGKLGNLLGGVDLGHMRLLHALCGLVVIGASYAFFRQFFSVPWALLGSAVLGLNHSFLMISRMAMRENTPVLVEVVALTLLLIGLRKRNAFATFAGGAVAGLGYYVHFPGRMIFPLWLAFLVLLAIAYRDELALGRTLRHGAVALAAFALVAGPYLIAYEKAPAALRHHQREALLLTPDGRKLQQRWVFASTVWGGIERNIVNGLTAFNTNRDDHANIYPNAGHGIVDPLTGVLLWLGALVVLAGAGRRRGPPWLVFPLLSFLLLWLAYAFLVGQAPDYPRMLIALPFVAFLVVEGVRFLAGAAARLPFPRRELATVLPIAAVLLAIGFWNGFIGWDFIHKGQLTGDDIGSTGRYVQRYSGNPNEHFYLAADQTRFPYYAWGWPSIWIDRLRIFSKDESQIAGVIDPSTVGQFAAVPPFVVFMRSDVWSRSAPDFMAHYPQARTDRITPDGRLIAVDVT